MSDSLLMDHWRRAWGRLGGPRRRAGVTFGRPRVPKGGSRVNDSALMDHRRSAWRMLGGPRTFYVEGKVPRSSFLESLGEPRVPRPQASQEAPWEGQNAANGFPFNPTASGSTRGESEGGLGAQQKLARVSGANDSAL